jgi:hypothetical protein
MQHPEVDCHICENKVRTTNLSSAAGGGGSARKNSYAQFSNHSSSTWQFVAMLAGEQVVKFK